MIEASFSSRHLRRLTNDAATGPRKCSETTKKEKKRLTTSPNKLLTRTNQQALVQRSADV